MALDLHYNTALPVTRWDSRGIVPTTATAVLRDAAGDTVETLTVTLPTATATLAASGSTTDVLVTTSGIGTSYVGKYCDVTSDGVSQVFRIARVDGTNVYPSEPLAVVPDGSSTLTDLTMAATIAAPGETKIGANWRLEWLWDDGTTEGFAADVVSVVRWKWEPPISARRVRKHIAHTYPATVDSREPDYWATIADEANEEIRKLVEATGRRPYLYGSSDVFARAGYLCAKYLLAGEGIVPAGSNPGLFQEQMRADWEREVARAISSLQMYDKDDDGEIDSDEAKGLWFSIGTSR